MSFGHIGVVVATDNSLHLSCFFILIDSVISSVPQCDVVEINLPTVSNMHAVCQRFLASKQKCRVSSTPHEVYELGWLAWLAWLVQK